MKSRLTVRQADSTFVETVTHWTIGSEGGTLAAPDGCWDLVVLKQHGQTNVLLTGQTTRTVSLPFVPGDEIMTISFKASAFLSFVPPTDLLDRGVLLSTTNHSFQLASDVFEIPTFENAEEFVKSLLKKEQLRQDEVVEEALLDHLPAYSLRLIQRRFLRATGMTQNYFRQIQRARQAAALLQSGMPATEVAFETGYSDQPHMSRSLKRILGRTPSEITAMTTL
ncbi:MAG TPA: helix-turn-helix transcriptional regulator [Anaerolineales bacterium]|nr:helix-turn-helix transcriptional regulator [Anaerolineales bacterium]